VCHHISNAVYHSLRKNLCMELYIDSEPRFIFGMDEDNYLFNNIPNEILKFTDKSLFVIDHSSMVKVF
jgi:hypothetical protein